ncbi:CBS domain-containing protein [Amycolatopsis japonica]|uniref:CBS domain-containing protein n=1 Tax=Amycolatopsis japonica TaxID=208439 RepID=UPI00366F2827
MSSAWQVRAGRRGERDKEALESGLVIVGWPAVTDLLDFSTRADLKAAVETSYPDRSTYVVGNWTGQLWRFSKEMTNGDLIVMPLKSRQRYAIGEITGPYAYRRDPRDDFRHVRPVRWLRTDVVRDEFKPDLRSSLGSLLTICQLTRHNAAQRIRALAAGQQDPGWRHDSSSVDPDTTRTDLWETVEASTKPVRLTVRELLAKWGFSRRTATSLVSVQSDLAERGISTRPAFTNARMDSVVELVPAADEPDSSKGSSEKAAVADTEALEELPTKWLVRAILPDDPSIETVNIGKSLATAITIMLAKDYSQLAVVDDDGNYAGAASWESIGRARLAKADPTLRDATTQVRVIDYDDELFGQIDEIYRQGFVLVRGADRRTLIGIVTANDLAKQFGTLARPFSILEEVELRLRRHTKRCLPDAIFAKFVPRWAKSGNPTFGGYSSMLRDPDNFEQLSWPLDHETFRELLDQARDIRNELMHFSGEALPDSDLALIEGFCAILRTVDQSG